MKIAAFLLLLATWAVAKPVAVADPAPEALPAESDLSFDIEQAVELDKRQSALRTTNNEFQRYGCRDVILFFARGTGEIGNMGTIVGPPLADALRSAFGVANVASQGIDYLATVSANLLPGGADLGGIRTMRNFLIDAASRCPDSALVASGYSQGAALVHRAVENLPDSVKARIAAAVTFGDTKNKQDGGRIPNFDPAKTLIICNAGDAVCSGTLVILAPHLDYARRVPEGASFIVDRVGRV